MAFDKPRRSSLVPRNVVVDGRRTSIRLERAMWEAFNEILAREGISAAELVTEVDRTREASTLTAAVRVYIMLYFRAAATECGHRRAGHGSFSRRYKIPANAS